MSKHTPGPWTFANDTACAEFFVLEIAEVAHMRVIPAAGGWPTPGNPESDARLIAAAPELLDALQRLVDFHPGTENAATQQARAAIAKALGETP